MQPWVIRRCRPGGEGRDHSQDDAINSCRRPLKERGCAQGVTSLCYRNGLPEQDDVGRAAGTRIGGEGKTYHAVGDASNGKPRLVADGSEWAEEICSNRQ